MQTVILQDIPQVRDALLPITFTRPVSEIRVGIFTIREKWEKYIPAHYAYLTDPLLAALYPPPGPAGNDTLLISSHIIPSPLLAQAVRALRRGQRLCLPDGTAVAVRGTRPPVEDILFNGETAILRNLYDIFLLNPSQIAADFALLEGPALPEPEVCTSNVIIGPRENLHIHPDAHVCGATLNLTAGPVYIGPQATVMEGASLRGPVAVCTHSEIRMGARIYEGTTVGPHCKVGGEIANVVFLAHSNKAHDGFLGNSVIGEWCNIGAGTVSSNLKNDYSEIKLWNYPSRRFLRTGLQFCGLIMGDHSKTGINTMINTATVFGVGVNFHGAGYPRNFVPSFTEGSVAGMHEVPLPKFLDIASRVLARRDMTLTPDIIRFFTALHNLTETYR